MRNPLSETIVQIEPSGIRKFFDIVSEMKDAISLGVGEPDFDTPWHIREEGIYSLEKGRTFYTSNAGLKELKQEICRYLYRRFDVSYNPDSEVMVTVGGSEAIDIALRAMCDPGDEVLIPQPSYVSYVPCTMLAGGKPVVIELEEKDNFKLTPEKLLEKITDKTKILVMPFPNNPTGAIMTKEDLAPIVDIIIEKDLFVISDEIYSELTYGTDHVTIAAFPEMKDRTILINGFSKSYAMTGWRIGYSASNPQLAKVMANYLSHSTSAPSTISQQAAITALTGPQEDMQVMKQAFEQRRDHLVERMNKIEGVSCIKPEGAFYVMMNMKGFLGKTMYGKVIESAEDFAQLFLEKGLVATVPCTAFAAPGFVRWSYATSLTEIDKGLDRLEAFIKNA